LFKQLSTRVSRSGIGNNSNYSCLQSKDMDTMSKNAPEDYSIGHHGNESRNNILTLGFLDT